MCRFVIWFLVTNLIETGSSEFGTYIKFSNGLLLCYGIFTNIKSNTIITLPYAYKDSNYSPQVQVAGINMADFAVVKILSKNQIQVQSVSYNSSVVDNRPLSYLTVGFWK